MSKLEQVFFLLVIVPPVFFANDLDGVKNLKIKRDHSLNFFLGGGGFIDTHAICEAVEEVLFKFIH